MSTSEADQPGSQAANQDKTEPMPPTQGHADPDAAPEPSRVSEPELETMNVAADDPQAPSADGAAGATAQPSLSDVPSEQTPGTDSGPGDAAGVPVVSAYPAAGTSEESPVAQGVRTPR